MKRLPRIVLAVVVLALGATAASCSRARSVLAHVWPAERFGHCTDDPRIFCEPGSEPFARTIAVLLPAAIAQVERRQYGAFRAPVKIYIYNSVDTYARYAGWRQGAATTSFGEVHLAPLMQRFPAQHTALLAHELSHLHLAQRAGALSMMRLPNWFTEGWATLTSEGGGTGKVRTEQAIFALVNGRHFTPWDTESLLSPGNASDFKLDSGMYYRQASLLVDYLQRRDAGAFAHLIREIETGRDFAQALRTAYGQPLPVLWQDFQSAMRRHPAAQWKQE